MCAKRNSNQAEQEDNEVRDRFIPNCVLKEIQIKRSRKITKWLGERVAERAIGTSFCKNYNSIAKDVILLQNNTVLLNAKNYKKYITQDGPLCNISNLEEKNVHSSFIFPNDQILYQIDFIGLTCLMRRRIGFW